MGTARDYLSLLQFKIIALLVLSTVAGFAIAYKNYSGSVQNLVLVIIGIATSASGAELLNKVLEKKTDKKMKRTSNRATVKGSINPKIGILYGVLLSAMGIGFGYMVNYLTALMIFLGVVFYVIVYTEVLKKRSYFNVIIGGFAGSFCVWAGVAAASNTITIPGLMLGLLVLLWIPGHIWSFALKYRGDYIRAGVPMLTAIKRTSTGTKAIAVFNVLMAMISAFLIPFLGAYYIIIIAIPLAAMLYLSFMTIANSSRTWTLFKFSSIFLALVFMAVIVAAVF